MRSLLRAFRAFLARRRFERDMREELTAHIAHRADDLVARGISPDDARRQARVEFGALEAYKEQCRDAAALVPGRVLQGIGGDLRLAARRLAATPLFTLFAVLSLAVGVGVTTAVYSVVDRIFWKENGVRNESEVAFVLSAEAGANDVRRVMSARDFADLRNAQTSFADLSASQQLFPAVAIPLSTDIRIAEAVDGAYFSVLGVTALHGRVISEADDRAGHAVVVLSHELWRARFGSDPDVVGRTLRLSGDPFEIIGIAPASFEGSTPGLRAAELWIPLSAGSRFTRSSNVPERERRRLTVVGRLVPGRTIQQATTELEAIATALDSEYPRTKPLRSGRPASRGWRARSIQDVGEQVEMFGRFGHVVFVLVALVLVVAGTNLANLVLARGTARQQEFAVRRALGASRWRLVREQLAESVILATAGGAGAWLLIQAGMRLFDFDVTLGRAWMTASVQPEISSAALAVSAGALLLSLLVFGLEPALNLTRRADVRADLAAGAGAVGVPRTRRQRRLIRWQVAVSAGFFIISALCVRFLASEARHDSGVDLDRIGITGIDFYLQRYDEPQARAAIDRIINRLRETPGVDSASASTGMPFGTTMSPFLRMSTPDKPLTPDRPYEDALLIAATPGYFRATGTSILRGRAFDARDGAGANPVVVLSESTARKIFGTSDVVGRQMLTQVDTLSRGIGTEQPVRTASVIGVAEDTDTTHFFTSRSGETAYVPLAQVYFPMINVVARADTANVSIGALRAALQTAAPDVGVQYVTSGRTALAGPFVFLRSAGLVALCLGGLTLLLAMVGLYGVQSHVVAHRTREIGVRMSFGATTSQIRRMVLIDGYSPVLQGLAIGLFIGFAGRALVRAYLEARIDVIDPWMLLAVPVPLLLAAFFACFLPAYRASRVDPNVALRHL